MSDTSSGSPQSRAKSPAKAPAKKNAGRRDVLAADGVLANLPRTRPQRSSARRDAARRATASAAASTSAPARKPRTATAVEAQPAQPTPTSAPARKPRFPAAAKVQPSPTPKPAATKKAPAKARAKANPKAEPRTKARPKARAKRAQDPVPRQGFETEGDPVSGPVKPPGSVELLSSAAELAGELTKSGLSSGGRLLKDFIARLPLN
jgi:ribonuclease E